MSSFSIPANPNKKAEGACFFHNWRRAGTDASTLPSSCDNEDEDERPYATVYNHVLMCNPEPFHAMRGGGGGGGGEAPGGGFKKQRGTATKCGLP
jgi:hypothetical protein